MKPFTGVGYRPQPPISPRRHARVVANIAKQEAAKPYRALKPPHPNTPSLIKAAVTDPTPGATVARNLKATIAPTPTPRGVARMNKAAKGIVVGGSGTGLLK
jgi:hypothetical protein